MKTDSLIAALAADTTPERPMGRVLWPALVLALAVAVLVVRGSLGFRADLAASLAEPLSVVRFVLTGALGALGLRLALVMARPEGRALSGLLSLALPVAVALGLWVWAYGTTPPEGRQMALVGKTMVTCLVMIPLLSVLPVAAIVLALRQGATTTPALAGFAAGLGGSGLAAMVYAMHCTEDSPMFYVTWYGLAIAGVTLVATLIGARLLRW